MILNKLKAKRLRTTSTNLFGDALEDGRVFLTRFDPERGGSFMITAEEALELMVWLTEVTA